MGHIWIAAWKRLDEIEVYGGTLTTGTPILDRLEKRELIKRMNDPNDRRAIVICLTVKGYALRSCVYDTLDAINQKFTAKA